MKNYNVYRNDELLCEEVQAHTPEDAIDQVQNRWTFDNFGQGGAMTQSENMRSDDYFDADFQAYAEEEQQPVKMKKEIRAYLVDMDCDQLEEFAFDNLDDKTIQDIAEAQGTVYTLPGLAHDLNNEFINMDNYFVRFIEVSVPDVKELPTESQTI